MCVDRPGLAERPAQGHVRRSASLSKMKAPFLVPTRTSTRFAILPSSTMASVRGRGRRGERQGGAIFAQLRRDWGKPQRRGRAGARFPAPPRGRRPTGTAMAKKIFYVVQPMNWPSGAMGQRPASPWRSPPRPRPAARRNAWPDPGRRHRLLPRRRSRQRRCRSPGAHRQLRPRPG